MRNKTHNPIRTLGAGSGTEPNGKIALPCRLGVATILLTTLVFCASSIANENEDKNENSSAATANKPAERIDGFWPTPRMIDGIVGRWAAEAAKTYELRPDQAAEVGSKLRTRWTEFLDANRRDMQPLINEYVEARLALEPPTADDVARWAAKAMPVYQRLRTNIEKGETEVRELLSPQQRIKFDARRMQRWAALRALESSLKRWSVGNYKRSEWWDPPPGWRDKENNHADDRQPPTKSATQTATARSDAKKTPDRVALELHAWEQYVIQFCDTFDLDQSQRNAAQSMLRELLDRANSYVDKRRDQIDALERKIADPAFTDRDKVDRELEELYGPLDRMFKELGNRLNKLPTRAQQQRAAQTPTSPPNQTDPPKK